MEIERKFLTKELPFDITAYPCKAITQAYLSFSRPSASAGATRIIS